MVSRLGIKVGEGSLLSCRVIVPSKSVKKTHFGLSLRVSGKGIVKAPRRLFGSNVGQDACRQSRKKSKCELWYELVSKWQHCVVFVEARIGKSFMVGEGSASSEHVFFLRRAAPPSSSAEWVEKEPI